MNPQVYELRICKFITGNFGKKMKKCWMHKVILQIPGTPYGVGLLTMGPNLHLGLELGYRFCYIICGDLFWVPVQLLIHPACLVKWHKCPSSFFLKAFRISPSLPLHYFCVKLGLLLLRRLFIIVGVFVAPPPLVLPHCHHNKFFIWLTLHCIHGRESCAFSKGMMDPYRAYGLGIRMLYTDQ